MVKGVSRRVVVVKPEPGDFFDEAIFIVKHSGGGHSSDDILREACAIASRRARPFSRRRCRLLWALLGGAAGGTLVGAAWLLTALMR